MYNKNENCEHPYFPGYSNAHVCQAGKLVQVQAHVWGNNM